MLDEAIKTKLRDPAYLDRFPVTRLNIAAVRPDMVGDFEQQSSAVRL